MRCFKCNREIDDHSGKCTYCEEENAESVRVISKEEIVDYQGVTIDTGSGDQQRQRRQYNQNTGNHQVFIKKISLGSSGWLTKIVILVALAAIAAFLLFVALPVALIGVGIGIVVWMVLSFLRG